ncbi:MAG: outer membrane lipoprotein LolB [Burkholderiales bacterium]|nr:outer membrane lipoprotein LolB [Burkholderiales bacterium]
MEQGRAGSREGSLGGAAPVLARPSGAARDRQAPVAIALRHARRFVVACALALAACASLPPPAVVDAPVDTADAAFDASGRLSAKRGGEGVAAHFRWEHRPGHDAIGLATPMGATLARLTRDPGGASIVFSDGRVEHAADAQSLAARALGAPLPVENLAWWLRATPHPRSGYAIERDAAGRVLVLRQDGWALVYAYAGDAARPQRVLANYPDIDVRIVIDAWAGPAP